MLQKPFGMDLDVFLALMHVSMEIMALLAHPMLLPPLDTQFEDDFAFLNIIGQLHLLNILMLQVAGRLPPPRPSFRTLMFPNIPQAPNRPHVVDVWESLSRNPLRFWDVTGETEESLSHVVQDLTPLLVVRRAPTARNRVLAAVIWLRHYPTRPLLSLLFDVNEAVFSQDIQVIIRLLRAYFYRMVQWPTREEWMGMQGSFDYFPSAVGCIDGTLHQINRPLCVPQVAYYSGYKKKHCLSTQVIVDVHGRLRYLRTGFHGRMNDAGQFLRLPNIGPREELDFPAHCYLLGDRGYANRYPIITPFRRNQLAGEPSDRNAQIIFNEELSRVRVKVEHTISFIKTYRAVSEVYRHNRDFQPIVADVCGFLAARRMALLAELY